VYLHVINKSLKKKKEKKKNALEAKARIGDPHLEFQDS
jgi:hypothetical protein